MNYTNIFDVQFAVLVYDDFLNGKIVPCICGLENFLKSDSLMFFAPSPNIRRQFWTIYKILRFIFPARLTASC